MLKYVYTVLTNLCIILIISFPGSAEKGSAYSGDSVFRIVKIEEGPVKLRLSIMDPGLAVSRINIY